MPKRRRDGSTVATGARRRILAARKTLPASVNTAGLIRAAKAYAPTRVPRSMIGFPSSKSVRMRYVDSVKLAATSGVYAFHSFRANGIFDPDVTGTGHQPLGHDQWAQFYNHYVVTTATIKVTMTQPTLEVTGVVVGIYLNDGESVLADDYVEFIEQGKTKYKVLPPAIGTMTYSLRGDKYDAKKFFNLADVKDNVTRIGAEVGSNPADNALWIIWLQAQDKSNSVAVEFLVEINYDVTLSEPKELQQS